MTTVAFCGKIFAADRKIGGLYTAKKIWNFDDGSFFSGCGLYDHLTEVADWISKGSNEDKKPWLPEDQESHFILIDSCGTPYWLTYPYLRRIKFNEATFAIGSGSDFALGAMAAGKNAKQAVEIAARYDKDTGGGVDWFKVTQHVTKEK